MKIAAGTNRAWHVAGLVAALTLCGVAVIGVARWPDIQFELGYAYENGHLFKFAIERLDTVVTRCGKMELP